MRSVVVCLAGLFLLAVFGFHSYSSGQAQKVDLLPKIAEGQKLVKKETVQMVRGVVGTRRIRVGRHKYAYVPIEGVVGREMAIAVMNAAGEISVVRAVKDDSGLHVQTSGFILYMRRENGLNSDIAVEKPASGLVLALKYPVSNENQRFGDGPPVIEAVYTPYSGEIKTREIVDRGITVQQEFIDKAYSRLRQREVFSRAFPGKKVVDVIPKQMLTVLLMDEHIDPGDFRDQDDARPLVERVLTVIGTNREKAYAYSISSAGARGLVQMMPSTYRQMESLYASAGLMSDFHAGAGDPVNAIMSQILLCDSDWCAIREKTDIPASRVGPYLAAAYNGGVGRVISVLANDGEGWMEAPDGNSQPTKTVTVRVPTRVRTRTGRHRTVYVSKHYVEPIFKAQTNKYIRQYHWINNYFAGRATKGFQEIQDQNDTRQESTEHCRRARHPVSPRGRPSLLPNACSFPKAAACRNVAS